MPFEFTKMHGAGNDMIVLDAPATGLPFTPAQWRALSDRHRGIGFDQAMVLQPPRHQGFAAYYRIFNADGSEVEQCGNGVRCVVEFLRRRGVVRDGRLRLESPAGPIEAEVSPAGAIAVDMGEPDFSAAAVAFETEGQAGPGYHLDLPTGRVDFATRMPCSKCPMWPPRRCMRSARCSNVIRASATASMSASATSSIAATSTCACSSAAWARRRPAAPAPAPRPQPACSPACSIPVFR
jgi:hypothetical protein